MTKKKRKLNCHQKIIERFVLNTESFTGKRWAQEVKVSKDLHEKYGEEFWAKAQLEFKIKSLSWFLSPDGEKKLSEMILQNKVKLNVVKDIETEEDIVFHQTENKIKSKLDFLKNG